MITAEVSGQTSVYNRQQSLAQSKRKGSKKESFKIERQESNNSNVLASSKMKVSQIKDAM